MAFLFVDGMASYAATADLLTKWGSKSGSSAYSAGTGKYGNNAIRCSGSSLTSNGDIFTKSILGGGAHILGGFWIQWISGTGSTDPRVLMRFANDSVPSGGAYLGITPVTRTISVSLWGGSAAFSGTKTLNDGLIHFVEFDLEFHASTGHLYVHVDGNVEISQTGNTISSGTPTIDWMSISGGEMTYDYSHIVLYDNTGVEPTEAAFPFTQIRIDTLRPDGDDTTQFSTTSSGSTHYNLVDETVPDGADWVEDSTVGHQDLYTFSDMNFVPTAVVGVVQNVYSVNEGGGTLEYQMDVKSGSATESSSNIEAPAAYFTQQFGFPTDPNTSGAWTQTTVNAIKAGYTDQG